eukprot:scaffold2395_cov283-Chaetoceros_neogracile.AAC.12
MAFGDECASPLAKGQTDIRSFQGTWHFVMLALVPFEKKVPKMGQWHIYKCSRFVVEGRSSAFTEDHNQSMLDYVSFGFV